MSEVLDPPLTHPVSRAVDALEAALDDLVGLVDAGPDGQLWTLPSAELVEATASVHRLGNRVDAVLHAAVREVDARGAALEAGAPSTAAWLRHRLRMHPATAKRLVESAQALHTDPAGPLVQHADAATDAATNADAGEPQGGRAALRAGFAAGQVSSEHVQVVAQVLATLPPVDAVTAAAAEVFLAEQALVHDPKALAQLGRHLRHVLDPDAGDRLAREEERAAATQTLEIRQRRDGGSKITGRLGPELTASLLAQLSPLAAPRPADAGVRDTRTVGERNAEALAELLRRYAGAEVGPTRHGAHTTVTVTMALETLQRRLGAPGGWLDWSGPISAETARRLACDARLVPVVLGANGEPLDVGRSSYPVTQAIWRALVARDGGCAFAGCDRPPEWCDAHHRVHWEDGGDTSEQNCCLLCDFHHRRVHHHGWDLELIDGQIWTVPPPWIDPARTPRRNTGRAQLAALATKLAPPDDG